MRLSDRFVPPDGSDKPLIYIIGEAPGREEDEQLRPFVGASGKLLRDALKEAGVPESSVRIWNTIPYRPLTEDDGNRTPEESEIDEYKKYVQADIRKTKPQHLLCVGRSSLTAFVPSFDGTMTSAIKNQKFEWEGIPIQATWHPSYCLRKGGRASEPYTQMISHIKTIGGIGQEEAKAFEMFEAHQIDEFLAKFSECAELGYDVEGSSLEPLEVIFELAGFSFATPTYSAYLILKDFWDSEFKLNSSVMQKIKTFFEVKAQHKSKICVFNMQYEAPVTLAMFDCEPQFFDTMQNGRALNITGGLKYISQAHLGAPSWTKDLDDWLENMEIVQSKLRYRRRHKEFFPKQEQLMLEEHGMFGMMRELKRGYAATKKSIAEGGPEFIKYKEGSNQDKLLKALTKLIKILHGIRPEPDVYGPQLQRVIMHNIETKRDVPNYCDVPKEILGKYCCQDSQNTINLMHYCEKLNKKMSMEKTADFYNEHIKLAYNIELSGVYWDDKKAQEIFDTYYRNQLSVLKTLITSNQFFPHMRTPVLDENGKSTKEVRQLNKQDLLEINACTDIETLKLFYNPNNSTADNRKFLEKFVLTPTLKMALLLDDLESEIEADAGAAKINYPNLFKLHSRIFKAQPHARRDMLEGFRVKLKALHDAELLSDMEIRRIATKSNYVLPDLQLETIKSLFYGLTKFMGVEVDDETTWTKEARILFNYKMFKKLDKAMGTYIKGGPGRQSVWKVEHVPEKRMAKRLERWHSDIICDASEVLMYCPSYQPNTAATRRWTSGAHTVPAGSELRQIQVSRFENGFVLHYDYSQMEVRVLAALANETALLQAFRDGTDVHKYVASQVWQIPMDQVSHEQRRDSKRATFSLLYGKMVYTFAREFMNGDVAAATALFDMFFGAFPGIKGYIEDKHKEFDNHGYVTTLWGEELHIKQHGDSDGALAAAHREAQNWPIQNAASQIAGLSISRVTNWMLKKGFLSRTFAFTHDAGDLDAKSTELFPIMTVLPSIAESSIRDEFDIPVEIDMELGVTAGQLVELKKIDGDPLTEKDGSGYTLSAKFDGRKKDVEDLTERLNLVCSDVEVEVTEEEDKLVSLEELFVIKRAYSLEIGQTIPRQKGVIHARYAA